MDSRFENSQTTKDAVLGPTIGLNGTVLRSKESLEIDIARYHPTVGTLFCQRRRNLRTGRQCCFFNHPMGPFRSFQLRRNASHGAQRRYRSENTIQPSEGTRNIDKPFLLYSLVLNLNKKPTDGRVDEEPHLSSPPNPKLPLTITFEFYRESQ